MITSVNDKLRRVESLLRNIAPDISYHYRRPPEMKRFIVWQEEAEDMSFSANNRKQEICMTGTIDVYTPNEYDQLIDDLTAALAQAQRIQAQINAVQYEDETGLIHYTFAFWVI